MQRAILVLTLLLLSSVSAYAQNCSLMDSSFIQARASLNPGQCIHSPNKEFILIHQKDGNVVLYRSNNILDDAAVWNTQTSGNPGARLVMQKDGNVVVYDGAKVLYTARSYGSIGDYFLMVQDDASVVAYRGIGPDTKHGPVWSSIHGVVRTKALCPNNCRDDDAKCQRVRQMRCAYELFGPQTNGSACHSCRDGDARCQLKRQSCNGCLELNATRVGAGAQCVPCVSAAMVGGGSIGAACAQACGSAASANEVASNKGC